MPPKRRAESRCRSTQQCEKCRWPIESVQEPAVTPGINLGTESSRLGRVAQTMGNEIGRMPDLARKYSAATP